MEDKVSERLRAGYEIGICNGTYCWLEVNSDTGKRRVIELPSEPRGPILDSEGLYAEDEYGKRRLTPEAEYNIEMEKRRRSGRLPPMGF